MLDNLYENLNYKLKKWAKIILIIGVLAAILNGIYMLLNDAILTGLVLFVAGTVSAWLLSLIFYALGELVEKAYSNEKAHVTSDIPETKVAVSHKWRCDNCGKMRTKSPCEHCGCDWT